MQNLLFSLVSGTSLLLPPLPGLFWLLNSFHRFSPSEGRGDAGPGCSSLNGLGLSSEPGFVRRLRAGNVIPGWHLCSLGSAGHTVFCCLLRTGGRMSAIVCGGIMSAQCESQLET